MIKPYTAVGLIPTVRGIRKRADIKINLDHLEHLVKAASWLSSLDLPVRLIALAEGALQAFNDEVLDLDHVTFARECAIDIPGEETEALGKIAKTYNAFIMAQAKAKHPEIKDRFFNVGFILNPQGEVILQHYKVSPLFPVEHSVCPHDILDWSTWTQFFIFERIAGGATSNWTRKGKSPFAGYTLALRPRMRTAKRFSS